MTFLHLIVVFSNILEPPIVHRVNVAYQEDVQFEVQSLFDEPIDDIGIRMSEQDTALLYFNDKCPYSGSEDLHQACISHAAIDCACCVSIERKNDPPVSIPAGRSSITIVIDGDGRPIANEDERAPIVEQYNKGVFYFVNSITSRGDGAPMIGDVGGFSNIGSLFTFVSVLEPESQFDFGKVLGHEFGHLMGVENERPTYGYIMHNHNVEIDNQGVFPQAMLTHDECKKIRAQVSLDRFKTTEGDFECSASYGPDSGVDYDAFVAFDGGPLGIIESGAGSCGGCDVELGFNKTNGAGIVSVCVFVFGLVLRRRRR